MTFLSTLQRQNNSGVSLNLIDLPQLKEQERQMRNFTISIENGIGLNEHAVLESGLEHLLNLKMKRNLVLNLIR